MGTKILHSTAQHPKIDGQTECQHRTIQYILRLLLLDEEYSTWFTKLPYVKLAINTTVHVSTGHTLFMLVHVSKAKLPINLVLGTSSSTTS